MIVEWVEYKRVNAAIEELADKSDVIPKIKEILCYVTKAGGKRTRPLIAILSAKLCGGDSDDVINFALAVELIHTASLVHDDVIDKGMMRRNLQTLNLKYGIPLAILLGDWLISKSVELVSVYKEEIIRDFARLGMFMVTGEILDVYSVNDAENKKDYFDCISAKTAEIFAYSAENACKIVSDDIKAARNLFEYGKNLGIAYQLVDDLIEFLVMYDDKRSEFESKTLPLMFEKIYGLEESVLRILYLIRKHTSISRKSIEYFEQCESKEKLFKLIDFITEYLLRNYGRENRQFSNLIENFYKKPLLFEE